MASIISFLRFGKNEEIFSDNMKSIKTRFTNEEVASIYNSRSSAALNAISPNLYEAVKTYCNCGRGFFTGKTKKGYIAELLSKDGINTQLIYLEKNTNTNKYTVYGAICDSDDVEHPSLKGAYTVAATGVDGYSGTAVLLALMPVILEDEEAVTAFNELKTYVQLLPDDPIWLTEKKSGKTYLDCFAETLCLFTDNVYRRLKSPFEKEPYIKLPETQKEIKMFRLNMLEQTITEPHGTPLYFKEVDMQAVMDKMALTNGKNFNGDEKKKIPVMDKSFRWSDWIMQASKYITASTKYAEPIRTCYFIGPAGCGKSLGTMGIASLLKLPYDHITCQSSMEIFDFLGQIFPNTNPSQKMNFDEIRQIMDLPSVEDIIMDKIGAYVKMYRKSAPSNPADIDQTELICDMVDKVNLKVSEMCDSKDYTYIEGGLVKAIRYGYAFEIQEIGIIKRAGVAVGLNALLETGKNAFITLPTGEVVRKNPNCVIFFTSNDEYEGTNNLNQSVLSRMGHVVWFKNSSTAEMAKRAKAIVNDFYDDNVLLEMANVINDIVEFCKDKGITDGVCGQRELNNWAMEVMIDMEEEGTTTASDEILRRTCQTAVLGKVAQNSDDIIDIAESIVDPKWGTLALRI